MSLTASQTSEPTKLSPPPNSRGISVTAVVFALALVLLVATLGGAGMSNAVPGSTSFTVGLILSTAGILVAGVVLWTAVRSLNRSFRVTHEVRAGEVLEARATAASAIHDGLLSFGVGLAVLIAVGALVMLAANNAIIQTTFLRLDLIAESAKDVILAFGLNVWIAVVTQVFVLVFGLLLAVARIVPGDAGRPIRAIAIAYIDGMRAVPAIIVIYLIGFGLPLLKVPVLSGLSPVWFAIIALTLTYSAYMAEIYRSGIEGIHPSQWSASRSLGFSYAKTLRFVILPQAIRGVIPPMLSAFIALQKDTSLVNIIGTMDAFNQAKFYSSAQFNLSAVTVVAVLFIIITIPQTRVVDWLLARDASRRGRKGGK